MYNFNMKKSFSRTVLRKDIKVLFTSKLGKRVNCRNLKQKLKFPLYEFD